MKKILITGGAGFIGSHVVRNFVKQYSDYQIYNLDLLTYAGNLANLKDIEDFPNYHFIKGDIADTHVINSLFQEHRFDAVIHLAAESHVDRSITDPLCFVKTNVVGTVNLLQAFAGLWSSNWTNKLFYHISTDEVYGTLGDVGLFTETTAYDPNSPYSASKASSDHFVRSYGATYGLPYVISNCSNNYGPFQFPEKLIPLCIQNCIDEKPLPIYGDGKFTRDWLYVEDHVRAIDLIFHKGTVGATYNIGGLNEWKNIDLVSVLCNQMDGFLQRDKGYSAGLIQFVTDRPGHDLRYAIDASKLIAELGWAPTVSFEEGLTKTIQWYMDNEDWLNDVKSRVV